jgi:hypothetical protein
MIQFLEGLGGDVLGVKLSGRLHDEDYDRFVPMIDDATTTQGKVRLLVLFEDFHGWHQQALWDDINFAAPHSRDIARVAMVGDKDWAEWMTKVGKPFTRAEIKQFGPAEIDSAKAWIES